MDEYAGVEGWPSLPPLPLPPLLLLLLGLLPPYGTSWLLPSSSSPPQAQQYYLEGIWQQFVRTRVAFTLSVKDMQGLPEDSHYPITAVLEGPEYYEAEVSPLPAPSPAPHPPRWVRLRAQLVNICLSLWTPRLKGTINFMSLSMGGRSTSGWSSSGRSALSVPLPHSPSLLTPHSWHGAVFY